MDTGALDQGLCTTLAGMELKALKPCAWDVIVKCMTLFVARRNSATLAED